MDNQNKFFAHVMMTIRKKIGVTYLMMGGIMYRICRKCITHFHFLLNTGRPEEKQFFAVNSSFPLFSQVFFEICLVPQSHYKFKTSVVLFFLIFSHASDK